VSSWAQNDPTGASQWLTTLPDDKAKQGAVQSFVNNLSYRYPDIAAPWAESISDPNQRTFAIQNVAGNWMRMDPTAAKAWIQTLTLPDDVKARLLKTH